MPISRRSFLKQVVMGGAAALMFPGLSALPAEGSIEREEISGWLLVTNAHTDESLSVRYLTNAGRWIPSALYRLNHLFRCHYDDRVKSIHPRLFVLLDQIHTRLDAGKRPLELISGYRSPAYNRLLMSRGSGVVGRSYHLKGMAADIYIPGVSLEKLRDEAKQLQAGGVGFYSQFVHVDVGPVRYW